MKLVHLPVITSVITINVRHD